MSGEPTANPKPKRKREQRRDAAEEVCWKLLILIGIGELEHIPLNLRPLVAEELERWALLAVPPSKEKRGPDRRVRS